MRAVQRDESLAVLQWLCACGAREPQGDVQGLESLADGSDEVVLQGIEVPALLRTRAHRHAFTRALQRLLPYLAGESEQGLAAWRERDAFGADGRDQRVRAPDQQRE
jgi:hypothetical protein